MDYLICNIETQNNILLENQLTNVILKSTAYNSKIKNKTTKKTMFMYVVIPIFSCYDPAKYKIEIATFKNHIMYNQMFNNIDNFYSIYILFESIKNSDFTVNILFKISDNDIDIFYTDGSSNLKSKRASYATVKIMDNIENQDKLYDDFSKKLVNYVLYSGSLDGTNNVGELTGIQKAIDNFGDRRFQLIISDSEYSIKSFREWIHNWKNKSYVGSNNKTILNCDLIKNIEQKIESSNKIYLFKWVKGHNKTIFNELCDTEAKNQLGID